MNGEFEIRTSLVHFLYELQKDGRFVTEEKLQEIIPDTNSYFDNLRSAITRLKENSVIQIDNNNLIVLDAKISNEISNIENKLKIRD